MAGNTIPIHGKVARVEKNNVNMEYTEGWNIAVVVDVADISRQGQNWKEVIAGQASWSGSMSGFFVPGNTEQNAIFNNIIAAAPGVTLTDMAFNLEDAGDYLSGNLIITGLTIDGRVGDKVLFTANFIGTAALSITLAA